MKRGTGHRPLMKSEIELAQSMSRSASEAARVLGITIDTYKLWATRYGIYENLLNQGGKGIPRVMTRVKSTKIPLKDVLDGKHPSYNRGVLQKRLVNELILDEACDVCGFREKRITDLKVPLKLNHINGDRSDHRLENLQLLCYNCWFLTVGNIYGGRMVGNYAGQKVPKSLLTKEDDEDS